MSLRASLETMDLTTTARVRALAGTVSSGSSVDELIGDIVTQVSARMLRAMGRHGPTAERTEVYLVRPRSSIVLLDGAPVDPAETLTVYVDDTVTPTNTALTEDDYVLHADAGWIQLLDFQNRTSRRRSRAQLYAQVTYTGGLAEDVDALLADADRADIVGAATMQARHLFERRDKLGGDKRVSMGGGVFSSESSKQYGLLDDVWEVVRGYRRERV